MPSRKTHTKSRRGCAECKRRHTKCDEVRPECSTCTRLGIECRWPSAPTGSKTSRSASEVTTPSVISSFDNISANLGGHNVMSDQLAIADLKLLHHFTTKTYATLDTVVSQQCIWQDTVIQIGFQYPFVLRGVLAIAAVHLAMLNSTSRVDFIVQASTLYNRALVDFRNVLRSVNDENCTPIFAFSCLTVIHAFAIAQVQAPQDPVGDLLNCMHLIRGVNAILQPHWVRFMTSELSPLLENGWRRGVHGEIPEILQLKALVKSLPGRDQEAYANDYIQAIDQLHAIMLEVKASGDDQSCLALLFSWPVLLPQKFFSLLSTREPIPMIITAHFAAIFQYKADCWWLANWGKNILRAVGAALNADLRKWLQWPDQISNMFDRDENRQTLDS